jgi:hypothetical protein
MNSSNSFSHDSNSQFALSYELLHLLQWLSTHDTDKLKKLISKAVAQGLHDEIQLMEQINDQNVLQDMHQNMIDFFSTLDDLLFESINEHLEKKARQKNLLPTLDHIDSSLCDIETMRLSIETTTKKLDNFPNTNPKEQLCKELLKKWKPVDKNCLN